MNSLLTRILLFCIFLSPQLNAQDVSLKKFSDNAYGTAFAPDGKRVAYDMRGSGKERYFEIHVSDTLHSFDSCITCGRKDLPQRHNGSPNWQPTGKYIVFVAEKPVHDRGSVDALPGFGAFTDIWVLRTDGSRAYQLTNTPNDYDHGIIGPRFSADGKKIAWVERKQRPHALKGGNFFGLWVLKSADFIDTDSVPRLANIKTFEPGGDGFYESYGYSPDGKRIIFCSNLGGRRWWNCQVYTIDAETGGDLKQLTSIDYNEHAVYTPDGAHIIWMTNTMNSGGTDWWIMNPDGTGKQRLSYFNEKTYSEYAGKKVWCGLGSYTADGKTFFSATQTSLTNPNGIAWFMRLRAPGNGTGLKGEYFSNENFQGTPKIRRDAAVYNWFGKAHPDSLVSTNCSIRWTGMIASRYSETYTFYAANDRGLRVWIDGKLMIDEKTKANAQKEKTATVMMTAGKKYSIKVEYTHKGEAQGIAALAWSSASQRKQAVPAGCLYEN